MNRSLASPILRQLDVANGVTLLGLKLSLLSVVFAIHSNFHAAALAMIYAGIVDMADGFIARKLQRTELQAEVGKHLDSLVDVCSFGFAPAVFAYCYGLNRPWELAILMIFLGANALRLAYFNSVGMTTEGHFRCFTGLPVTYSSLFVPLAFALSFIWPAGIMKGLLTGLYLLMALLMVSNLTIRKPRKLGYVVLLALASGLTILYGRALLVGS